MEFCLLGPFIVRDGERTLPIPRGKQRTLLAALLARTGQVIPAAELSELLWDGRPPQSAHVTLQNYVRRLRQTLGPTDSGRLRTQHPGYVIDADAEQVDLIHFGVLCDAGQAAARRGDWIQAGDNLRRALSLWRGQPFLGVASELLVLAEAPRLSEMRTDALETRIEVNLHLGMHHQVIGELRQLAGADRLRERPRALLMLALYRAGRPSDALAEYQDARRTLISELGLEPGSGLRQLHGQILRADPSLDLPSAVRLATDPAAGQGAEAEPAVAVDPVLAEALVPRQLPAAVAHFAGRQAESAALTGLLDRAAGRLGAVTVAAIVGTAGVGKTALALHCAHQVAGRFSDGQLYANLGGFGPGLGAATPREVLHGFLRALGVPPADVPVGLQAQAALYRTRLAGRRVLVVLDNARDAEQVRPLLPGSPGGAVLVTSRVQLTGLVAADGADLFNLSVLSDTDAAELLAGRLDAERLAQDPAAARELTGLCARLPLALATAAARAASRPSVPLAALAAELRADRLGALATGEPATDLRASLSWSYDQLSRPSAELFRLLGAQPGADITVAAAASLAGVDRRWARAMLAELTGAHLLQEPAPDRFGLHDLLRAYAIERASGERASELAVLADD